MPHTSPYEPLKIPEVDLWGFIFERPSHSYSKDKALFIDPFTGASHSYAEIVALATSFGRGLQKHWGWTKGDVLCFYTPNHIDTPILTWGSHWAGGVCSPANPLYTADELAFQLKDSGSRALVTQGQFLDVALKAAKKAGINTDKVLVMDGDEKANVGAKHWRQLLADGVSERVKVDPKTDLSFLCYSSGTTGLPKGVRLTHWNIVSNITQIHAVESPYLFIKEKGGDKQMAVLPFFHIYGLVVVIHMTVHMGLPTVVLPRFELERACQIIQDHQVTTMYVPPPIILALGKHPAVEKYDLSSLRVLTSGAAPLTRDLVDGVWERLKIPVKQGYGLSETSPVCQLQTLDDWAKHVGAVGKLVANMEAIIADVETGEEMALGEPGELWVRGPNVFSGYHNRPELNRDIFVKPKDGNGPWFKTGDIAYVDKKGNYYITDRLKELIKYKGFQVPPAELEGLLLGSPDIADVCVVGVYDKSQATELPRAYVVPRQKPVDTAAANKLSRDIAEWMASRVTPHKKLRGGVVFIDEIPKTASGKILRRVLKDKIKEEEEGAKAKL